MIKKSILIILIFITFSNCGQKENPLYVFTSDIDNFWIAYDSVQSTSDTVRQTKFIQELYLDKATEGLKEFMVLREHSAKRHLMNILNYPKFWISLRPKTLEIQSHKQDIEKLMIRFKKLYPEFKQPEIYFTIGCLNSGGTISHNKILIGSEIACSDKEVDASELGSWLQGIFNDNLNVVSMVAHEAGHTQQKNAEKLNLLGYCISEGACDFISELLQQKKVATPYMTYGKANEKRLWKEFEKEMYGQEIKNWLYNGSNAQNGNADLGYFIGYSICKSYYENSKNKKIAIKEIIELDYSVESVLKFLEKSKYEDKIEKL